MISGRAIESNRCIECLLDNQKKMDAIAAERFFFRRKSLGITTRKPPDDELLRIRPLRELGGVEISGSGSCVLTFWIDPTIELNVVRVNSLIDWSRVINVSIIFRSASLCCGAVDRSSRSNAVFEQLAISSLN
jgi:hypothetical protein